MPPHERVPGISSEFLSGEGQSIFFAGDDPELGWGLRVAQQFDQELQRRSLHGAERGHSSHYGVFLVSATMRALKKSGLGVFTRNVPGDYVALAHWHEWRMQSA
jgi:hypothetical protein